LRDAITSLLSKDEERSTMAVECRRVAVEEYALEVQARRYAALYELMTRSA
jgi:glycosyltransferase involved in cell wall biosynthesis